MTTCVNLIELRFETTFQRQKAETSNTLFHLGGKMLVKRRQFEH